MNIDPWILAFSAATVIATIWMGFWSARRSKTASDFYVAGRSVSVGWNASAISGEYLSAASFMGVAGMVMSSGYDALWYPVCYACGYLFLLLFIAGPLRRFGAYTIPDFAEGRYDSPVFRKIAVVFVLFIGFFYTMPQMKGAGTTLAYIFPGLPYWAGVVLVGAVITLNVALGGMKGITLVQAFQYWAKMFAISVPIFVLMAVYGHYGKQLAANGIAQHPTSTFQSSTNEANKSQPSFYAAMTMTGTNLTAQKLWTEVVTSAGFKKYTLASTNGMRTTLWSWLFGYARIAKRPNHAFTLYVPHNSKQFWNATLVLCQSEPMTRRRLLDYLERCLETNGVKVVLVGSDAIKAFPLSESPKYAGVLTPEERQEMLVRSPLPEKAPADSTWLSPFGPLTAKAAKATKAQFRYAGELIAVTNQRSSHGALNWAKRKFVLSSTAITGGGAAVTNLVQIYAEKTLAREAFSSASYILRFSPTASTQYVQFADLSFTSDSAIAKALQSLLATNGITVLRERNLFTATATKELVIKPLDTKPYALLYTYSLIIALVCGTAGLPHILVRFYTNPDGVAAKRTTMWVMILIGIFYVFPPVFGVMGRNLLPELYAGLGAKGTDKIVLELPRLLNEKYAPLGSILSGITCAGAFAAFMSTFSGLLVSMTGALAHDVYGRMFRPKSTPEQRLRAFKVCAVIVGAVAILLGMQVEPFQINFMVGQAFAIAAASYFPLLFMSAWWRGMTMKGAAAGMLTGGLLALIGISLTSFTDLKWVPLDAFWAVHPLWRILCEQPAIWAVPLAIALMVVVSKLTTKEIPSDIRMKMLVLHAPEKLGLKQEYIQEHQHGH